MSFNYKQPIPKAKDILEEIPLSNQLKEAKKDRDREIIDVLTHKSSKFLVIVGPCSADNEEALCEYLSRLKKVHDKVKDKLVLVPRIYTNKPRTTGEGYKGMAHQPVPTEDPNLVEGLKAIRKMHIRAFSESGLSAADEMLYPGNFPYLEDLLSYVAVGARSVENQQHRLTVSGLDVPAGMKNPTGGDIGVMLNSIKAAQLPHTFIYHDFEVETPGNPYAHAIIRGAMNQEGKTIPNYHYEDLMQIKEEYFNRELENPCIIVDVSHANSNKDFSQQPRIVSEVLHSMRKSDELQQLIRGVMIESYLVEGSQKVDGGVYGKSITDSCLGWDDSEKLLYDLADSI